MRGIKLFFPFLDNLTISSDDSLCIHDEFLIHLINYFGRFLYALFWVKFYFISLRICIWFGSLSFSLTHDKKNQSRLSRKTHWKRIGWFMITHKSILYNHEWSTENHKFIFSVCVIKSQICFHRDMCQALFMIIPCAHGIFIEI